MFISSLSKKVCKFDGLQAFIPEKKWDKVTRGNSVTRGYSVGAIHSFKRCPKNSIMLRNYSKQIYIEHI